MKRSKTLLAANILSTLYVIYLFTAFIGMMIKLAEAELTEMIGAYFAFLIELAGSNSSLEVFLCVVFALLCIHVALFFLGFLFGWIAYAAKKSGLAKFAATLYLLATICFPIYIFVGLPITIVGFIGGGKQKQINRSTIAM